MAVKPTIVSEGSSSFFVPQASLTDPHHCEVFYNPAMEFNRSLSSFFLSTCLQHCAIAKPLLFDGFTGVGIRGVRYLKESGVGSVVFCDAGDSTIPYVKKNISRNKLDKKSKVMHMDVNQALANSPRFDVIELDPFGSPLHCIDSAFRRGKKKFLLSLTFTDLANLCGGHKEACKRYYNATSINCTFSHELALRIILARVASIAACHDFGILPLVSWYQGHYVKVFLLCEQGAVKADNNFAKFGFCWLCRKCNERGAAKEKIHLCPFCSGKVQVAGPLWLAPFSNKEILKQAPLQLSGNKFYTESQRSKLASFLRMLVEESEIPLFYSISELCGRTKTPVPKFASFIAKLQREGFEATSTHFAPGCVKTNAPFATMLKILQE